MTEQTFKRMSVNFFGNSYPRIAPIMDEVEILIRWKIGKIFRDNPDILGIVSTCTVGSQMFGPVTEDADIQKLTQIFTKLNEIACIVSDYYGGEELRVNIRTRDELCVREDTMRKFAEPHISAINALAQEVEELHRCWKEEQHPDGVASRNVLRILRHLNDLKNLVDPLVSRTSIQID